MIPEELCLTPSAFRILHRLQCDGTATDIDAATGQLVTVILEEESLASALLHNKGVSKDNIPQILPQRSAAQQPDVDTPEGVSVAAIMQTLPTAFEDLVGEARRIARRDLQPQALSSGHLLAATLSFDTPTGRVLQQHGVIADDLFHQSARFETMAPPIPVSFSLDDTPETQKLTGAAGDGRPRAEIGRVLDACMNRAREGVRVLEDYARFLLNSEDVVRDLKSLRHRLAASERSLAAQIQHASHNTITQRDVANDVGTDLSGSMEQHRVQIKDIIDANARRVQEALRSLEEFGKLASNSFAEEMKQLRYRSYDVHQRLLAVAASQNPHSYRHERLTSASICVLVTAAGCHQPWQEVVTACLRGGAGIIQLREKQLDDRELISRARWLTETCRDAGALAIINDRPDVTVASGADGVHLGQDDCDIADARRLLGSDLLIGLSTHSTEQLHSTQARAADYLGVGPVFPSQTKQFEKFVGPELLQDASSVSAPWFAIGGINQNNLSTLTDIGVRRVAISSAAISQSDPEQAVAMLASQLPST